jgi:hypothetical protein
VKNNDNKYYALVKKMQRVLMASKKEIAAMADENLIIKAAQDEIQALVLESA